MIQTRKIVYGAMIAALMGVVSLLNSYTAGTFDSLIGYFMVIPYAWYGRMYSLKDNLLVCFASVLVVLFTGLPSFLIVAIYSCVFGAFVGECLRRKVNKSVIMTGGFLISFVVNMLQIYVFAGVLGIDITREMTTTYQDVVKMMPAFKQTISLASFLNLIPLMVMLLSALECYVMLGLCQVIMKRMKIDFPANFHIATFNIGRPLAIVAAIVFVISFYLIGIRHYDIPVLWYAYYGSAILFILQGIAYLSFMLILYDHPKATALLFILILIPYVLIFYGLVGAYDAFACRRQKIYNSLQGGSQ